MRLTSKDILKEKQHGEDADHTQAQTGGNYQSEAGEHEFLEDARH
jgi:hypothetical protein